MFLPLLLNVTERFQTACRGICVQRFAMMPALVTEPGSATRYHVQDGAAGRFHLRVSSIFIFNCLCPETLRKWLDIISKKMI